MSNKTNFLWSILKAGCIGALAIVASCDDTSVQPSREAARYGGESHHRVTPDVLDEHMRTFYGPAVPIGQGVARAWVAVNIEGEPVSLGVNLSEHAVMHQPEDHAEYVLHFPQAAEAYAIRLLVGNVGEYEQPKKFLLNAVPRYRLPAETIHTPG